MKLVLSRSGESPVQATTKEEGKWRPIAPAETEPGSRRGGGGRIDSLARISPGVSRDGSSPTLGRISRNPLPPAVG